MRPTSAQRTAPCRTLVVSIIAVAIPVHIAVRSAGDEVPRAAETSGSQLTGCSALGAKSITGAPQFGPKIMSTRSDFLRRYCARPRCALSVAFFTKTSVAAHSVVAGGAGGMSCVVRCSCPTPRLGETSRRLPDGGAELRRCAFQARQEDGTGAARDAGRGETGKNHSRRYRAPKGYREEGSLGASIALRNCNENGSEDLIKSGRLCSPTQLSRRLLAEL